MCEWLDSRNAIVSYAEVLADVREGLTARESAESLAVSLSTVIKKRRKLRDQGLM